MGAERAARADRVKAGRLRRRGAGLAELAHSAARHPEQEEVEHGQKAELERDRDRLGVQLLLDVEDEADGAEHDLVARAEARRVAPVAR